MIDKLNNLQNTIFIIAIIIGLVFSLIYTYKLDQDIKSKAIQSGSQECLINNRVLWQKECSNHD